MTIFDQIIYPAIINFNSGKKILDNQVGNKLGNDEKSKFYKERYIEISKQVNESEYSNDLLLQEILLFESFWFIMRFLYKCFQPMDTSKEIEFLENESDPVKMGKNRQPIVRKSYDFSYNNEMGVKILHYITNLFMLREIKGKLGYDVNQYPVKCGIAVFKFENEIYIWENSYEGYKRLTIDPTANEEILIQYNKIICGIEKSYKELFSLLEGLPFIEGEESQKAFDIIWYRHIKLSPLTYRCFPNTNKIDFSFPRIDTICRHKGEYCIKQKTIDLRYEQFLNLLNALNENEKEELLLMTIDYFNKFLNIVCSDNPIHKNIYTKILEKLNKIELPQGPNGELGNAILQQSKEDNTDKVNITKLNPYPRIFKDLKAFELFEYLFDYFNGTEIKHSDCSFIFGQMKKDEYILEGVKDKEFRDFLRNGFNASLSGETLLYQIDRTKLKTLEFCKSDSRMREYLTASRGKM